MSILKVKNLSISFGGLKAVDDLSFEVEGKTIFGLIGPNGAGKTTVFNCISRFYTPDEGSVKLNSKGKEIELLDCKVHEVIKYGMVRTFQNVELIKEMSVIDNLLVGIHYKANTNIFEEVVGLTKKKEEKLRIKAREVLRFLGLESLENSKASAQPYGVQKLIELGRTLMSDPSLIILDEPAAGMNTAETKELERLIEKIRDELEITILLVEHDMGLVMGICEKICVINFGKKIAEGTPQQIKADPRVQEAYLGGEEIPC